MTEASVKPMVDGSRSVQPVVSVPVRGRLRFLSPLSGAIVLVVDNALFGANAGTGMLATPVVSFLGFAAAFGSVFSIQRFRDRDSRGTSLAKGFLCGVLTGIPMSIAGTALGSFVILASGLDHLLNRKGKAPVKSGAK